MFPRSEYALAWEHISAQLPERSACRLMVELLDLADRANVVAELIVHFFEVVDVEKEDAKTLTTCYLAIYGFFECSTIGDASERIDRCFDQQMVSLGAYALQSVAGRLSSRRHFRRRRSARIRCRRMSTREILLQSSHLCGSGRC